MKHIVIIGAGGHGSVAADIFESAGVTVEGLYDDSPDAQKKNPSPWDVKGTVKDAIQRINTAETDFFVAIGDNATRKVLMERLQKETGKQSANCISPKAILSRYVALSGTGICIAPGAIINGGTQIHSGVIVNTGATVDHDCVLYAFSSVQPGAHLGGGVSVGEGAMIGIGASIRQYHTIGKEAIVGGGAMVVADVDALTTVLGVPAKPKET